MTKSINLTIHHNGFHGRTRAGVRIPANSKAGDVITINYRQAIRLNSLCCGISNCLCGEHIAEVYNADYYRDQWYGKIVLPDDFDGKTIELRGNHPQN